MIDLHDSQNWDEPLFPISLAAKASLVAPNTMRMWFERKRVVLQPNDKASSPDSPTRLLTLRSVLALAATAELSRGSGEDVSSAEAIAKGWIYREHVGEVDGKRVVADPAGLFPGERVMTVLVHFGPEDVKVVPVKFDNAGQLAGLSLMDLFPSFSPIRPRATVLALDFIFNHVVRVCDAYLRDESAGG